MMRSWTGRWGCSGRRLKGFAVGCLGLVLMGCISDRPMPKTVPGRLKGPIDQIHLLTGPTALNLDQAPGPDGFMVRVYATSPKTAATVVIGAGTLEVLMFEGVLKNGDPVSAKPLHVWTYSADELTSNAQRGAVGIVYLLTLLWGDAKPAESRVTLMARYLPSKGTPIHSGPTSISVGVK